MKKALALVLALVMAAVLLTACGGTTTPSTSPSVVAPPATTTVAEPATPPADTGKVLRIYCWNDEFKSRFTDYFEKAGKLPAGVTVEWVTTPSQNNAYQNKLDADLPSNVGSDNPIDLFLIEADYALKYVNSDVSMDIKGEVGITDADLAQQYKYTQDIATEKSSGKLKATSWQATPGLFAYRRSIAKAVLGTDDPVQVQAALSDWTKFNAVAEQAKAKGYKMLSGYDDSYRVFGNNIAAPLVDANKKIVIDPQLMAWVDQTKTFTDKGYNNKTSLWAPEWSADQGPKGKVFGFFYSTWGINFTLLGNSLAKPVKEGGKEEVGNGIYGDWAVCEGPAAWYWGGTWICAAKGTDNVNLVRDVMKTLTCDAATMKKITTDTQDYTNNKAAMNEIANSDFKSAFLGGQNHIKLFATAADKIDMKNISPYDQGITEKFQAAFKDYFDGKVTKEKALENFYTAILETYPTLSK